MVQCNYVIQIIFGKNKHDLGAFITCSSNFFKFCFGYSRRLSPLSLPFVQATSSQATYFDHLFTAVSMVCVTGLFTQPVATTYNIWGQLICMFLIQIGGLGLMTFIGVFYIQSKQKLSLRSRETILESFSYGETQSLMVFIRSIFLTTFIVEGLGAFLLSFRLFRNWLGPRDFYLYLRSYFSFL